MKRPAKECTTRVESSTQHGKNVTSYKKKGNEKQSAREDSGLEESGSERGVTGEESERREKVSERRSK